MKKIFSLLGLILLLVSCQARETNNLLKVNFDSQGGSSVLSQEVSYGSLVTKPIAPSRTNYEFTGWFKEANCLTKWNFTSDVVTADLTLYAGWEISSALEGTAGLVYELVDNAYTVIDYEGTSTTIVIPNYYNDLPVVRIEDKYGIGVFANNDMLKVVYLASNLEVIGPNSFYNCRALETVNLSTNSHLRTLGNNAFSGATALKEFYFPTSLVSLGEAVFNNCESLERFIIPDDNKAYAALNGHLVDKINKTLIRGVNNTTIPEGVEVIGEAAFRRSQISSLSIPSSIKRIENYIIDESLITTISYNGTKEAFDSIEKASAWNLGKEEIEVEFNMQAKQIYLTVRENKVTIELVENSSTAALLAILATGDIVYSADDYGGFEKVGYIGHNIVTNNEQITTKSGDIVLYQGNQICIMFGSNSWSYTRIGRIEGYDAATLRELLYAGEGEVEVRLSLN